jgi:putative peptidoglycan lipid II flippase
MAAGVIVTLVSLPVYWLLYHAAGAVGLSLASDIAILFQTGALALLLNRRRIVCLSGLQRAELGRALLAMVASLVALYGLRYLLPSNSRIADVVVLAAGTAVWLIVAGGSLYLTGSTIPRQLRTRLQSR